MNFSIYKNHGRISFFENKCIFQGGPPRVPASAEGQVNPDGEMYEAQNESTRARDNIRNKPPFTEIDSLRSDLVKYPNTDPKNLEKRKEILKKLNHLLHPNLSQDYSREDMSAMEAGNNRINTPENTTGGGIHAGVYNQFEQYLKDQYKIEDNNLSHPGLAKVQGIMSGDNTEWKGGSMYAEYLSLLLDHLIKANNGDIPVNTEDELQAILKGESKEGLSVKKIILGKSFEGKDLKLSFLKPQKNEKGELESRVFNPALTIEAEEGVTLNSLNIYHVEGLKIDNMKIHNKNPKNINKYGQSEERLLRVSAAKNISIGKGVTLEGKKGDLQTPEEIASSPRGIYIRDVEGLKIEGTKFTDTLLKGIELQNVTGADIKDIQFDTIAEDGIFYMNMQGKINGVSVKKRIPTYFKNPETGQWDNTIKMHSDLVQAGTKIYKEGEKRPEKEIKNNVRVEGVKSSSVFGNIQQSVGGQGFLFGDEGNLGSGVVDVRNNEVEANQYHGITVMNPDESVNIEGNIITAVDNANAGEQSIPSIWIRGFKRGNAPIIIKGNTTPLIILDEVYAGLQISNNVTATGEPTPILVRQENGSPKLMTASDVNAFAKTITPPPIETPIPKDSIRKIRKGENITQKIPQSSSSNIAAGFGHATGKEVQEDQNDFDGASNRIETGGSFFKE